MPENVLRGDTPSRALARILAVADVIDTEVHPALAEALSMGRKALQQRDEDHRRRVLVVGATTVDASLWVDRYGRHDGAVCQVVSDRSDLALAASPLTVVVLDGAEDRDDWPNLAAEIAVLGEGVDVIRQNAPTGG